jgi:multidrug efflux system outer membrane protein
MNSTTNHSATIQLSTLANAIMLSVVGALLLTTAGCATIHDKAAPFAEIDPQQVRLADDIKLARDGWPEAQWWRRYGDTQLDSLIEQAFKDAPMMAAAKSRVTLSGAQVSRANSIRGLQVGFSASIDRQDLSANSFLGPFTANVPSEGLTGPWYTEGTLGLDVSYSFDLWGKDHAKVDAALGVRNARKAEAAETELVLSTRITQVYFDIQELYAMSDLLRQARDINLELIAAHQARAARGLEAQTQTELARARKLELDRQINAADGRIAVLREAMRALVGAGPDNLPVINAKSLPDATGKLPVSLGYELLARRPDLQAKHWYVQASLREIDVAKAAYYPSIDIKSFFGLDALHLADLFHSSSKQINLIPGLSLPIFDNGRLDAELAGARAQSNYTVAQYNQSVLDAVREVAQAGIELQNLQQQAQIQDAKLHATAFAADSAQALYQSGLADKLNAIEAMLPVLSEQGKMVEIRGRQIDREVALTMALGGGYQIEKADSPQAEEKISRNTN